MQFDVLVIGAGPGGYTAAIKAAQNGKKTCLIEQGALGGVCLNEGCIPTKTFMRTAGILQDITAAKEYGIECALPPVLHINMPALQARKNKIVKQLTSGIAGLLKKNNVQVIAGTAHFADAHTIAVGTQKLRARHIIIATGSQPIVPKSISIQAGAPLLTSKEALDLNAIPKNCGVVGGGVIGIEFAYILAKFGAKVHVFESMPEILPTADAETARLLRSVLEAAGVAFHTGVQVQQITKNGITYTHAQTPQQYNCEKVLVAVGRAPSTTSLGCENAGIKLEKGAIKTDAALRTNTPHIYAIGDVNGHIMLAHTASQEAEIAVQNICGNPQEMDYSRIPSVIYTHPEAAWIGQTEAQLTERKTSYSIGKFPMAANGRALVEGETAGFVKILSEKTTGEILGVHIVGSRAGELISEISLAMALEATPAEILAAVHPHPTVSECIPEAAADIFHKAVHK